MTVAALFVDGRGSYSRIDDVEIWDQARDARTYDGPHRVVAHPPCSRWCRLAGLVQARYGHRKGDDGGCFAAALASVREHSGVLEHPAYSDAWDAFELNHPPSSGGWVNADFIGGWTCHVEQRHYGHPAKKATWLYAHGVDLPALRWGRSEPATALVSYCANHTRAGETRPRLSPRQASATPRAFLDALLSMARSEPGNK